MNQFDTSSQQQEENPLAPGSKYLEGVQKYIDEFGEIPLNDGTWLKINNIDDYVALVVKGRIKRL